MLAQAGVGLALALVSVDVKALGKRPLPVLALAAGRTATAPTLLGCSSQPRLLGRAGGAPDPLRGRCIKQKDTLSAACGHDGRSILAIEQPENFTAELFGRKNLEKNACRALFQGAKISTHAWQHFPERLAGVSVAGPPTSVP